MTDRLMKADVPKPKIIEIPLEKNALVVDKRDLTPETRESGLVKAYIVAKLLKNMAELFEINRVTANRKPIQIISDELITKPIRFLIPVVTKTEAAKIVAQTWTDGRVWSDPPHNITRYMHNDDLIPLVAGVRYGGQQALFDDATLNDFIDRYNGYNREFWNMAEISIEDLESDVAAKKIARKYGVAPSTVRAHRRRLQIPPAVAGRKGGVLHGVLWAGYRDEPIEKWLSGENLAEYLKDPDGWQTKADEYWNRANKRRKTPIYGPIGAKAKKEGN